MKGAPGTIEVMRNVDRNAPEHPFFSRMRAAAKSHGFDVNRAIRRLTGPEPFYYGVQHLKSVRESRGLMTATKVAATLKIERSQLRQLVDSGVLGARESRGVERIHEWFSDEDVVQLDAALRSRTSSWTWSRRVGLSNVDVRQLLAARVIGEHAGVPHSDLFAGLQLDTVSLDVFEGAVRRSCIGAGEDESWLPLVQVFRCFGGGYKPWAEFLKAAADGRLKHGLGRGRSEALHFGRLCIHPDDARSLAGRIADGPGLEAWRPEAFGTYRTMVLSWGEAENLLNCFPADVARLLEIGLIQKRHNDDESGIDAESAERFARDHVSVLELAALTGRNPKATAQRLAKAGWHRDESGFWPRSELHALVEALQPRAVDPLVVEVVDKVETGCDVNGDLAWI